MIRTAEEVLNSKKAVYLITEADDRYAAIPTGEWKFINGAMHQKYYPAFKAREIELWLQSGMLESMRPDLREVWGSRNLTDFKAQTTSTQEGNKKNV